MLTFRRRRTGKKALYPNRVWSYDSVLDGLISGKSVNILAVIHEYSGECLVLVVDRSIRSGGVIETLEKLNSQKGDPECCQQWLMKDRQDDDHRE